MTHILNPMHITREFVRLDNQFSDEDINKIGLSCDYRDYMNLSNKFAFVSDYNILTDAFNYIVRIGERKYILGAIPSVRFTMSLDDFSDKYIKPIVNREYTTVDKWQE